MPWWTWVLALLLSVLGGLVGAGIVLQYQLRKDHKEK